MIDGAEQAVRLVGAAGLLAAWLVSGSHAVRTRARPAGRRLGLASRFGALATYLMAAIPYFVVWIVLWRPLPGTPPDWLRVGALLVGGALGFSGLTAYLWGRLTLGAMYNVSSVLGSELYADHRLVAAGPFRYVRHPMYCGIAMAALGALMVYRTWAMVFAVAALPAFAVKARHEERLLAAEFGAQWEEYTERVPAWWPRRPRRARPRSLIE
jgi:protein-S-isoprenylcysteine O-methyltransferase Ste14